jgi:hypothetical protein
LISFCSSILFAFPFELLSLRHFPLSFFPHKSDIRSEADYPVTFRYRTSNSVAGPPASFAGSVVSSPERSV